MIFFSFAIKIDELPTDLKLESASIYFAYLLKETLYELGSCVWLKWPNDFYIDDLMRFLKREYYIGLFSAAALYGAAHQQ